MGRNLVPVALLAGLLLVAATGCPDTEVLETGNFQLNLAMNAKNDGDWACVLMDINEMRIKPVDGSCENNGNPCFNDSDCPGSTCLGALAQDSIIGTAIDIVTAGTLTGVNFSDQGTLCEPIAIEGDLPVDARLQYLSRGRYKITRLQIARPSLVDSDGTVTACDGFATNAATLAFYADDLYFTIGGDESNTVQLLIDAEALGAAFAGPDDCVTYLATNQGINNVFTIK